MPERFIRPLIEQVGDSIINPGLLREDTEQQQQQQQQQQGSTSIRRYLTAAMTPEEEVVTKLTTEIRTINKLVPKER